MRNKIEKITTARIRRIAERYAGDIDGIELVNGRIETDNKDLKAQKLIATDGADVDGPIVFSQEGPNALNLAGTLSSSAGATFMGELIANNAFSVSGSALANSWTAKSSIRFKEDVKPLDFDMDKIMQLRPVEFVWKEDKKEDVGFIAEEVGVVIPKIIEYENNGVDAKGLDYTRIIPYLIECVKEQQKRIEKLEKELLK